jgi:hypothetical protein
VNARFVHVGFTMSGTAQVPVDALEKLFATALDWIRYDPHCWILYTSTELDTWRDRIRALPEIKPADGFLLLEVDANARSGYMEKFAWEWLQKVR